MNTYKNFKFVQNSILNQEENENYEEENINQEEFNLFITNFFKLTDINEISLNLEILSNYLNKENYILKIFKFENNIFEFLLSLLISENNLFLNIFLIFNTLLNFNESLKLIIKTNILNFLINFLNNNNNYIIIIF